MNVVKFGGHAMHDEHGEFARAILQATMAGEKLVIVHGGGPQISQALTTAGIDSEFIGGFRVTTPVIFSIVEQVLAHQIGPAIAQSLERAGVKAIAVSGKDSHTLIARALTHLVDGTPADLGLVGEIVRVDSAALEVILENAILPVVSPLGTNNGQTQGFNINADLAAAAIAGALSAKSLIIMTDVPGIYRDWPDTQSLIEVISAEELSSIKSTFVAGMAPKVQACLDAISGGARAVRIIDGRDPAALSLALAGRGGTLVTS